MTNSLVLCSQPSLSPSSRPYCSVTVIGSCLCVVSSTARYILVSSSTTCSLTSRKSPLEPTDDILGREKSIAGKGFIFCRQEQAERHQRRRVRGLVSVTSSLPQPCAAHHLLRSEALPPPNSDTSLRCKQKSPSLKLVTDTPATLSSPMTAWAWDFLESVRITCLLVRRRIREEV